MRPESFELSPLRIDMLRDEEKQSFIMKGNFVPGKEIIILLFSHLFIKLFKTKS